jgi:hypothetical protein
VESISSTPPHAIHADLPACGYSFIADELSARTTAVKRDPGRSRQFAALRGIQLELTEIGAHRAFCTGVILSTIHLSTCWTSSTHSTTATGWFSKTFVPQNY